MPGCNFRIDGFENSSSLTIFTYNTCSLVADGRFERLLEELEGQQWDVVVVQESRREAKREVIHFENGHVWYGSGGCKGSCGVGFLVHKHLCKHKFCADNERLAVLDIACRPMSIRILSVYMPDTSHSDLEVEVLFCKMEGYLRQGRLRGHACVVAGDMNAQVGKQTEMDNANILGPHGAYARTRRGQGLLHWCELQGLSIANTFFRPGDEEPWTYCKGKVRRQLDYLLVDLRLPCFNRCTHRIGPSVPGGKDALLQRAACLDCEQEKEAIPT